VDASKKAFYENRKVLLLIALVSLIVLIWILQWNNGPTNTRVESAAKKNPGRSAANAMADPHVLAEQLKMEQPPFEEEKRNLFDFFKAVPPPPPAGPPQTMAQAPQPVCGNQACEAGEDPTNCPTDCQPPPPPIPPITLRYIGYMSEQTGAIVFLTDGKEVYIGRQNDIIANKYRVLKITAESVELGYLNMNESRTIPFQGSQGG
jgi:hypothetical protein